jgi:probable HAF family extracellular repeat protein
MLKLGILPGMTNSAIGGVGRVGDMNFATFFPKAINERGQIVGTTDSPKRACHPFLWQEGRMTDLGSLPGGTFCQQPAINEHGQVAGTISKSSGATTIERAYVWANGKMTYLPTLGGPTSFAAAINDRGEIVGSSKTAAGVTHAVLWTPRR